MAYGVVPTVITGDQWTAGNQNTYIRDNFKAGIPDIFTTAGEITYGTGGNGAELLALGAAGTYLTVNAGGTAGEWSNDKTFKGCIVYTNLFQPPSDTWVKATFAGERYDSDGYWSNTDNDAVLIPSDGVYKITGNIKFPEATLGAEVAVHKVAIGPDDKVVTSVPVTELSYFNMLHQISFCYVNRFTSGTDVYLKIWRNDQESFNNVVDVIMSITYLGVST